jgi:hypothetical protein
MTPDTTPIAASRPSIPLAVMDCTVPIWKLVSATVVPALPDATEVLSM